MNIKTITVHAGRTIPHPLESYSNLRPSLSMTAELCDGDDPADCLKQLQSQAEGLVQDHAKNLVDSIVEADRIERETREMRSLELSINEKQRRLEEVRANINGRIPVAAIASDESPACDYSDEL